MTAAVARYRGKAAGVGRCSVCMSRTRLPRPGYKLCDACNAAGLRRQLGRRFMALMAGRCVRCLGERGPNETRCDGCRAKCRAAYKAKATPDIPVQNVSTGDS